MKRFAVSSRTPSRGGAGGLGLLRLAALLALLAVAACEPMFVFPGGALSGSEGIPPADWEFSLGVDTVQLETRPAAPYSVNVWGVGVGPNFYVAAADAGDSIWAQAIEADARVRLRIGERIYPLAAKRVGDDGELAQVVEAYAGKYGVGREDGFVGDAWVYRLATR